ncbi:hypothetical protein ScFU149_01020 [Streptococcus canis]|uniref:hypothetical protein n=1 Tax=Streptococcus canis TaxID=1329 RepID=UPI000C49443B|nr:hypothetical protein [Streptococcus canis]MDV5993489.1 hypothetical protein [Streptococcus canis]QKG74059.1 hypothetical protein GE023_007105 [Streptococcus canis]GAY71095.1 uncharacterized protein TANIYAMA4_1587 [Streptococcus canis]GFK29985.1 hypothetical protein ScFU149_01020 [Streptococcus canis]
MKKETFTISFLDDKRGGWDINAQPRLIRFISLVAKRFHIQFRRMDEVCSEETRLLGFICLGLVSDLFFGK